MQLVTQELVRKQVPRPPWHENSNADRLVFVIKRVVVTKVSHTVDIASAWSRFAHAPRWAVRVPCEQGLQSGVLSAPRTDCARRQWQVWCLVAGQLIE